MTRKKKLAGLGVALALILGVLFLRPDWLVENLPQTAKLGPALTQQCASSSSLHLNFYDNRPSKSTPGPSELLVPACAAVEAARKDANGRTSWMSGLRFSLTGEIGGVPGQAVHNTGPFSPTFIEVSPSAMSATEGILAFTLSHEIGHGQLRHKEGASSTGILVAVLLALLVLVPGAVYMKKQPSGTATWRYVLAAVVVFSTLIFAYTTVNPKAQNFASTDHELEADKFALTNLKTMGYTAQEAEVIAACMFAAHLDAPAQSWMDTENPHPSTVERLRQLGLENRIRDLRSPAYCISHAVRRIPLPTR
jgi:hypothetical protein